jgi:L-ascorbate metabolism protein UlaG (beta-lactamase superfamily)
MKLLAALFLLALAAGARSAPAADEFPTSAGAVRITPIQHASLMIQAGGQVIYVDPAQGKYEGLPPADLILYTHTHGDHLAPAVLAKVRKPATAIIAPEAVAKSVPEAIVIRNGETRQWGKWSIAAVPMYNLKRQRAPGQAYHPKGEGNGYVLAYGGKRFYIAGDTEDIPEMRALRQIDVAFIPMNLPYTMTPEEAAAAVRAFRPQIVYPYHSRGSDTQAFAKALEGTGVEVRLRNWYGG